MLDHAQGAVIRRHAIHRRRYIATDAVRARSAGEASSQSQLTDSTSAGGASSSSSSSSSSRASNMDYGTSTSSLATATSSRQAKQRTVTQNSSTSSQSATPSQRPSRAYGASTPALMTAYKDNDDDDNSSDSRSRTVVTSVRSRSITVKSTVTNSGNSDAVVTVSSQVNSPSSTGPDAHSDVGDSSDDAGGNKNTAVIIGTTVTGGVVFLILLSLVLYKFCGKRIRRMFSSDEIKWPELHRDTAIAPTAPLPARRTGGAGIEMGGEDSDEEVNEAPLMQETVLKPTSSISSDYVRGSGMPYTMATDPYQLSVMPVSYPYAAPAGNGAQTVPVERESVVPADQATLQHADSMASLGSSITPAMPIDASSASLLAGPNNVVATNENHSTNTGAPISSER